MSFRLTFWHNFLNVFSFIFLQLFTFFFLFSSSVGLLLYFSILSSLIVVCFLRHLFPFSDFFQTLFLYFCLNMKSNCYVVCRTQIRDRIDSQLSKVLCSRILCSETSSVQPLFLFAIHYFSLCSIYIFDVELGGDCENKSSYVKCNSLTPCFNV